MRERVVGEALRVGALALVTSVAAIVTWAVLGTVPAPLVLSQGTRVTPVARGALVAAAAGHPEIDARRAPERPPVSLTLIDAGREVSVSAAAGTVARFLGQLGIALGPLDRIDRDLADLVGPGDVLRIIRVGDREEALREILPRPAHYVIDPDLDAGRQVVLTRGSDGEALGTYLVRVVEGREIGRTLVVRTVTSEPVPDVIMVGARPRPAPRAPAEIESIIRTAAAKYGADPEQLLRVAWCESRYNPNAFNPAHSDSGLFQFIPNTWAANSVRAGYAGASPFDPVASANVAAWMFSRGSANLWTCR